MDTPEPTTAPKRRAGTRRMFRLAKKELVEILRDRRTIITLVLMPLLLYPLIGITVQKFLLNTLASATQQPVYRIVVDQEQTLKYMQRLTIQGSRILQEQDGESEAGNEETAQAEADDDDNSQAETNLSPEEQLEKLYGDGPVPEFFLPNDEDDVLEDMLALDSNDVKSVDLVVLTKQDENGLPYFELVTNPNSRRSQRAQQWLVDRFQAVNLRTARQVFSRFRQRFPAEFEKRELEIEAEAADNAPSLLTFIPLMLVLMTMTGAVYPAIDLTAGERERGTMEILVAAPVSRLALLFGKFVAVLAVAMLTAVFNILAMTITLYTLGLEQFVFGEAGLPVWVIFAILGLLLVFAGFFAATLLCLTSFARSFKEAQAYLIPLMLVSLTPGMLSLMPNVELTPMLALVPLVNIVILSRDLLAGNLDIAMIGIVVVSTVLYGFLALSAAARIFGTDSMLTGGGSSWSDFLKGPTETQDRPAISTAVLFMAVLFPAFIVIAGLASRLGGTINAKLLLNAFVTFGLFVLLPMIFAKVFRIRFKSAFLLNRFRFTSLIAAVLLGLSLWVLVYELEIYTLSKTRLDEMVAKFEETMKTGLSDLGLPLKLFCLALIPAVCEEFTFRGFLMSAFRKRVNDFMAILITAVLFGLFHVFVRDLLLFERMLPSTLMGIILGFVCLRTGSVVPGMVLHVLHNGLLLSIAHYESQLTELGIGVSEQQHLPAQMIGVSLIPIAIGIMMLVFTRRPEDSPVDDVVVQET